MQTYKIPITNHKNNKFSLAHLKGSIGQAVIETYLLEFEYDIYPYGYENNYANITRFVRRDYSDPTTTKIRSMPDLLVCDRDNNERFLLQIKATKTKDEARYWISKDRFDSYIKYWPEAILIVYCIPTANIYCCKIEDIKWTEGFLNNKPICYLNLLNPANFFDLPHYFGQIEPKRYTKFSGEIKDILKVYSQISAE